MKLLIRRWLLQNRLDSKKTFRRSILLCLTFFSVHLNSQTFQNLVPNGSFETYTNCPNNSSQSYYAPPWTAPECNSSDYFNSCSSNLNVPHYCGISYPYPCFLNAKDGQAYVGLFTYQLNYREYIQTILTSTLEAGVCYYVEFYVSNYQYGRYYTNNIAASLTSTNNPVVPQSTVSFCPTLSLTPHIMCYGNPVIIDTCKWRQVAGLYTANGSEDYITIGNFKNDANTDTVPMYLWGHGPVTAAPNAYILIDAVSVFSINPTGSLPWSYRDTTIIIGDSVYIGNQMGGNFDPEWYTISGNYIATNAGIYVKPATTSSYVVQYTVCGTPRADTVEVKVVSGLGVLTNGLRESEFKLYPNPAKNEIEIEFISEPGILKPKKVQINNVVGKEMKSLVIGNRKQKIDVSDLDNGVYFLIIRNNQNETITKKMVIAK